ncbi:hypothetical protein [Acinetobacter bereziniae]|uniref:hypothetical protein n=1 Tax=Acinetobacter bereziniae TaxID=106648 RepID=UPI003009FFFF
MKIENIEKDNFYSMVDSLKKSRRADLSDINSDEEIIEELYVDPLESDFVLKSCLKPNTTILIGRKGTGKSTIIARLQHEYRKDNKKLSLYIDVKSIFEQSKNFSYDTTQYKNLITNNDLQKYLLYKNFLKQIIQQIKSEVKTNTLNFFLANISKAFGPNKRTYEIELDNLFNEIEKDEYIDLQILKDMGVNQSAQTNTEKNIFSELHSNGSLSATEAKIDFSVKETDSLKLGKNTNIDQTYSEILLKCFNPTVILNSIKNLLEKIGIKFTIVCLDDFSEIDEKAMMVFVDTIIAPLNNWSEEFFKFKIAAYPGRIYLGDIDPQKIEQIKLDYYDLFQSRRVTDIQYEAQKSVKRLLTTRINYFCKQTPDYFFDITKNTLDDFYKTIFDITASVPRNIGWILWYAYQTSISKDQKITIKDLENASEKYYIDSIYPYFSQNKFMREPFNVKLEKYHLLELLQNIIVTSKNNKREISILDSKVFQLDKDKPPTSHFYINKKLEYLLSSLELNFFITKYNEQKDQDSINIMSFYSLNYGLCMQEDIFYGRGSDRKYIIQRRFNYTDLIHKYINTAKQIKCLNQACQTIHNYELLPMIQMFDMLCPTCKQSICEIQHVEVDITLANDSILMPEFDINLLNSLKIEAPQYPSSLAQELDCTYQKVSKRSIKLKDLGLVESQKQTFDTKIGERTYYTLTERAEEIYFKK